MRVPESILHLTESDVRQTMRIAEAVDLAEKGVKADAAGQVVGDKFYMDVRDAGFIKPFSGYLAGESLAFVKTFRYFPGKPERFGCSTTSPIVLLFDRETGLPVCVMQGGSVTALKTGASTAVTGAYLAHPELATVVLFGAGMLGRTHPPALSCRFNLRRAFCRTSCLWQRRRSRQNWLPDGTPIRKLLWMSSPGTTG